MLKKINKRGLSTVVTSLIMILLVLVAVGIIWIVIKNIITSSTEQMTLGRFTLDLSIKDVKFNEGAIDVKVKREVGEGELSGIKFVVSDGVEEEVFKEPTTMKELGSRVFSLAYSGLVKEVSIAPIFETESGKEFTGNEIDKFKFSDGEMMKNFGAVAWWRFEGDAQDEVGNNHGVLNGGVQFIDDAERGMVASFDGVDDYVEIDYNTDLEGFSNPNGFAISLWVNPNSVIDDNYLACGQDEVGSNNNLRCMILGYQDNNFNIFNEGVYPTGASADTQISATIDVWQHIIYSTDGSRVYGYKNGDLLVDVSANLNVDSNIDDYKIGSSATGDSEFNGTIDEVMIFNKALSEEQVKALYELELS